MNQTTYDIVTGLIEQKREGAYWDFKKQWHDDRSELLHDILCLCNNLEQDTSYLIIGIDENDDYRACDVSNDEHRWSEHDLTDWITKLHWFGHRWPAVSIGEMHVADARVDVVVIKTNAENLPYCLEKPNGRIKPLSVHVRRGEINTQIDGTASWEEVEALWRRHFKLDLALLDRIPEMLSDKKSWVFQSTTTSAESKYYRYDPLFTISDDFDTNLDGYEYYMFQQCDTTPHWGRLEIRYSGNLIYDCQTVILDGGRFTTVAPERSFFHWWNGDKIHNDITYCYYTRDSLDWHLHCYLYDGGGTLSDEVIAHDRFMPWVLVFDNDAERRDFEHFLNCNKNEFEQRVSEVGEPYIDLPDDYAERGKRRLVLQTKQVVVLQSMFDEYKGGRWSDNRAGNTSRNW